jgi:hypothetical protein
MPVGVTIKTRRGTAAEWSAANPTLAAGEPGYETDTGILKYGDGVTAYNSLPARVPTSQKTTRSATIVIAASNSSAKSKAQADYVCDGIDDNVEIQTALDLIKTLGGRVLLTEGTYHITATLIPTSVSGGNRAGNKVILSGMSTGAILLWEGAPEGWIIDVPHAWGFKVENLSFDGNANAGNGLRIYGSVVESIVITAQRNSFHNLHFIHCTTAIQIGIDGTSMSATNYFHHTQIDECTNGIYLNSSNADQVNFYGGIINGCENAIFAHVSGVVEFHNIEITNCNTLLRKGIIGMISFYGLTDEGNTAFFANDDAISTCNSPLSFYSCLLQSPATYGPGSFLKIISVGCIINQHVVLTSQIVWCSIGDNLSVGSITPGEYGTLSRLPIRNKGTATVTGASTSVVVTHGYPTPSTILVTARQLGQGGYAVTSRSLTTFTISFEVEPGENTWTFDWIAEY